MIPLFVSSTCVQYTPHYSASHDHVISTISVMLQDIGRLRLQLHADQAHTEQSQPSAKGLTSAGLYNVFAQPWPSISAVL